MSGESAEFVTVLEIWSFDKNPGHYENETRWIASPLYCLPDSGPFYAGEIFSLRYRDAFSFEIPKNGRVEIFAETEESRP